MDVHNTVKDMLENWNAIIFTVGVIVWIIISLIITWELYSGHSKRDNLS